jgi:hypothetical protein
MAIDKTFFTFLAPVLRELMSRKNRKVACLSYPDILMSPDDVTFAFPEAQGKKLAVRDDGAEICKWHGLPEQIEITDTKSFFQSIGLEVDFFDVSKIRGDEIVLDLNEFLPQEYEMKYDLVIDTGTLEHCFNVGIAFLNMCKLTNISGLMLTQAPLTKINHGFWNFSPCVYDNFFRQNGWRIHFIKSYYSAEGKIKIFDPNPNARFVAPPESIIISCASRNSESSTRFPIQQKYLKT